MVSKLVTDTSGLQRCKVFSLIQLVIFLSLWFTSCFDQLKWEENICSFQLRVGIWLSGNWVLLGRYIWLMQREMDFTGKARLLAMIQHMILLFLRFGLAYRFLSCPDIYLYTYYIYANYNLTKFCGQTLNFSNLTLKVNIHIEVLILISFAGRCRRIWIKACCSWHFSRFTCGSELLCNWKSLWIREYTYNRGIFLCDFFFPDYNSTSILFNF